MQKNLEDAKSVNKEIASTLEAVMSSHTQLQNVVESLQVDLGKKDTMISQLKTDKLVYKLCIYNKVQPNNYIVYTTTAIGMKNTP